nr:immunoglobulin heavy chain junction region [Macaca mulatta]MOV37907.1 immunoglobulin heavy chain junction region [Macaca mulatta]MOV38131.1 immunoglobulin heavy chain junction region [Macaca mulatta]MOV38200.1 immunoglobulin heavy chain junction region [Macaca mulatta]MOV38237.1 immunoglobulin heavy chain junction region [Macaca mulatta]
CLRRLGATTSEVW